MAEDRRTHKGWYRALSDKVEKDEPLSISESMLLALHNIQNHLHEIRLDTRESRQATEHVEGMLGALDNLAATMAGGAGIPYASSGAVRQALDEQRERARMAALSGDG